MKFNELSAELALRIKKEKESGDYKKVAFDDDAAIRRKDNPHDRATVWRSAFIRDVDKILNSPYYNRYADKTQVFSFYKNDDVTRRGLHVQLVSRIARTLGKALNLNEELIEAIALGHDIGHTPFGHDGESFLDELYRERTGWRFFHNIHSARVLDKIFPCNLSLQTLDGIACHNGEMELSEYTPKSLGGFAEFDRYIEACYRGEKDESKLIPCTLEGCVVRVSDIISYIGKDRQDAERLLLTTDASYKSTPIGSLNMEFINNLMVNIIENSYGKPYIKMDEDHFEALKTVKREDYDLIYYNEKVKSVLNENVLPMMRALYDRFIKDVKSGNSGSLVFKHHIDFIDGSHYKRETPYRETEPNQIVVDYIASMTDDYFIDLYAREFPKGKYKVEYKSYFD